MPSSRRISTRRRSQVLDHDRRKPERQLVDQQQLRPADQRAAERQHLPLAAGKQPADAAAQLGELREELVDQRLAPAPLGRADLRRRRRRQILRHGEIGKHLVALGHQHDAEPRDLVRRPVLDPRALERDGAFGDARVVDAEEAGDRAQRRGLAGAVVAEQRHDLAGCDG